MSDPRREAVARTLYRFVEGTMTDNRMPWPILCDRYPGTADHYRAMADETLTAIDATPGPMRCRKCAAEITHPDYDFMRHLDQVLQNHDKLTSETARDKHRASIVKFVAEKLAQASEPVATPGPATVSERFHIGQRVRSIPDDGIHGTVVRLRGNAVVVEWDGDDSGEGPWAVPAWEIRPVPDAIAARTTARTEPSEPSVPLSEIERMMDACLAEANKEANERYRSDPYPLTGMIEGDAVRNKKRVLDALRIDITQYIAARNAGQGVTE